MIMDFVIYHFQVALCWLIFLGCYYFIFGRTTFFAMNRWYLLGSMVGGILLPILSDFFLPVSVQSLSIPMVARVVSAELTTFSYSLPSNEPSFNAALFFWSIYCLGALLKAWRLIAGLLTIRRIHRQGKVVAIERVQVLQSALVKQPYSFFKFVFWPQGAEFNPEEQRMVLAHELAHLKGAHSWDIILLELIKVVFWFNPLVYWYSKLIKLNHEFLADAAVVANGVKQKYGHFLVRQSTRWSTVQLGHSIFHSPLKTRIIMMTKKSSNRMQLGMYALNFPIIFLLMIGLSDGIQSPSEIRDLVKNEFEIFTVSDAYEPPVFPGCELLDSEVDRQTCSQEKMMGYIFQNLTYPLSAREKNQMGTVVFSLKIGKDGSPQEMKLKKSVSDELDRELRRVLEAMPKWSVVSGEELSESVVVDVPIRFQLEGVAPQVFETEVEMDLKSQYGNRLGVVVGYPSEKSTSNEGGVKIRNSEGADLVKFAEDKEPLYIIDGKEVEGFVDMDPDFIVSINVLKGDSAIEKYGNKGKNGVIEIITNGKESAGQVGLESQYGQEVEVFEVVKQMPLFAGAKNQEESNQKLVSYISSNLEYPESEKERGAEGTVVVQFVVNQEGSVSRIEILKSFSDACSAAVVQMIENMNNLPEKWTPGFHKGKVANVKLALPVNFKLP